MLDLEHTLLKQYTIHLQRSHCFFSATAVMLEMPSPPLLQFSSTLILLVFNGNTTPECASTVQILPWTLTFVPKEYERSLYPATHKAGGPHFPLLPG